MPRCGLPASATARDWPAPHNDRLHAAEFPPPPPISLPSLAPSLWPHSQSSSVAIRPRIPNLLTHLPTHSPHGPLPSPAFRSDPYHLHWLRRLLVECGLLHFHDSNCETSETESARSTSPSFPSPLAPSESRSEAMKEGRYGQPFAQFVFENTWPC
jgi:hypothetical protein